MVLHCQLRSIVLPIILSVQLPLLKSTMHYYEGALCLVKNELQVFNPFQSSRTFVQKSSIKMETFPVQSLVCTSSWKATGVSRLWPQIAFHRIVNTWNHSHNALLNIERRSRTRRSRCRYCIRIWSTGCPYPNGTTKHFTRERFQDQVCYVLFSFLCTHEDRRDVFWDVIYIENY